MLLQVFLATSAVRWPSVPIFGGFLPLRCKGVGHRSILRCGAICWIMSSLRSLWLSWFPSTYVLYILIDMCDYLVVTRGMVSRGQGLTLAPLVTLLLQLDMLRLLRFHHHFLLLPVLLFARVLPVWEFMSLRRLPFNRLTVFYVTELLYSVCCLH